MKRSVPYRFSTNCEAQVALYVVRTVVDVQYRGTGILYSVHYTVLNFLGLGI